MFYQTLSLDGCTRFLKGALDTRSTGKNISWCYIHWNQFVLFYPTPPSHCRGWNGVFYLPGYQIIDNQSCCLIKVALSSITSNTKHMTSGHMLKKNLFTIKPTRQRVVWWSLTRILTLLDNLHLCLSIPCTSLAFILYYHIWMWKIKDTSESHGGNNANE